MQASLCETTLEFMNALSSRMSGCIIALDLGSRKVGVAKADLSLKIAVPLSVLEYKDMKQLSKLLHQIIKDNSVIGVVVGLPTSNHPILMEKEVAQFIQSLELNLPFILEDESYTTKIANTLLSEAGLNRKKRNMVDDKLSAKIILDSFLSKI